MAGNAERTLILQSHSWQVLRGWIGQCVDSVRGWAEGRGYEYRFLGDEIFDLLPADYRTKLTGRMPIQADLARLLLIQEALQAGYDRAVWFDADVLIFAPDRLDLDDVDGDCAFGREIWIDRDSKGRMKAWRSAHNAACLFRPDNAVLPFLIHATRRVIDRADPARIAPQMVGPKLITALDSIAGFGRMPQVGAFSPPLLADLDRGEGDALNVFYKTLAKDDLPDPVAANLCASLNGTDSAGALCARVIDRLLRDRDLPR